MTLLVSLIPLLPLVSLILALAAIGVWKHPRVPTIRQHNAQIVTPRQPTCNIIPFPTDRYK